MKIHLVVAHPEKNSFNFALHNTAVKILNDENMDVCISDLYTDNFNPVAGHSDVNDFPQEEHFTLAKAQRWAQSHNAFAETIRSEQEKLLSADTLIFQFPLWWWSYPAILKGWIDRVLASGFAYGSNRELTAKKVMYSITTGGAENEEDVEYYKKKINELYQDIFGFIGWKVLPAFIAHGVQQKSKDELNTIIKNYECHLIEHIVES